MYIAAVTSAALELLCRRFIPDSPRFTLITHHHGPCYTARYRGCGLRSFLADLARPGWPALNLRAACSPRKSQTLLADCSTNDRMGVRWIHLGSLKASLTCFLTFALQSCPGIKSKNINELKKGC